MNFNHLISFSPNYPRICSPSKTPIPPWQRLHQQDRDGLKSRIALFGCGFSYSQLEFSEAKKRFLIVSLKDEPKKNSRKKGSIAGAVALIIGTSIGTGILALPKKTSPAIEVIDHPLPLLMMIITPVQDRWHAGLLPSSITMTLCWAFLLIEALLLVEVNVGLQRKKNTEVVVDDDDDELEVMSIRTMAQETIGEWGGTLATMTYVFLGYTSMIAYCSKSGEILHHLTDFPESISGIFFTFFFTALISVGGTRVTDQVNQWLTASMIGLLISIEVLAIVCGGWSGFEGGGGDWGKVPETLPVMIFALVYHDLAPDGIILGVVPLLTLLVWEAIALGLCNQTGQVSDPVEMLLSVRWDGVPFMVQAFSLLAVGTSLIGTLLSFSEFFKEQLGNLSLDFQSAQNLEKSNSVYCINSWWEKNKLSITATAMVVAPSLVVSSMVPDAFSAATDIAGGYCMTVLYGVLPPAMAWAMNEKKPSGESDQTAISKVGPALIGVGLFACGIVVQQIFQDFSFLHH